MLRGDRLAGEACGWQYKIEHAAAGAHDYGARTRCCADHPFRYGTAFRVGLHGEHGFTAPHFTQVTGVPVAVDCGHEWAGAVPMPN